jgi:hypothetical protein
MTDHLKFKACRDCQPHLNAHRDATLCESCNQNKYVIDRLKEIADPGCICGGNWRNIVKEHEALFDRKYREVRTGNIYVFTGIVHSEDDYYYLLQKPGECRRLSCVGSIEGFGFELVDDTYEEHCPYCGAGIGYYPTDEHPITTSSSCTITTCKKTGDTFATKWQRAANSFTREFGGEPSIVP